MLNGSSVKHHGEKQIVGHADDGERVTTRGQRADVKKALCSEELIWEGTSLPWVVEDPHAEHG